MSSTPGEELVRRAADLGVTLWSSVPCSFLQAAYAAIGDFALAALAAGYSEAINVANVIDAAVSRGFRLRQTKRSAT